MSKSWKTTAWGIVVAIANVITNLAASGTVDPQTWIISIGIAVAGLIAKDWNVTGTGGSNG